jgi:hypothetical protein
VLDREPSDPDAKQIPECDIIGISHAYSLANSSLSYGQSHRRKSGKDTEIVIRNINLSKTDVEARQHASTLAMNVAKQSAIALLKFGEILRFVAHLVPANVDNLDRIQYELAVENKSRRSRKVFCLLIY